MENEIWFYEKGSHRRRGRISICKICEKEFIQRINGKKEYCSKECGWKSNEDKKKVKCYNCNKQIERVLSRIKNSKHGFHFCGRKCKEEAQSLKGDCPEIRPSHYGTSLHNKEFYHQYINRHNDPKCTSCDIQERYLLMVHHIDGNRENNAEENLEIVCWNCHIKRHLHDKEGKWYFSFYNLTPREMLLTL